MRRFLEVFLVVGLVATACSGGGATTTSVASPEATTSSTTLPVTTSTTMPDTTTTATTAAVTTTTGPPVGVAWSRVPHDEAVFGGPGYREMTSVTAGGPGLVAVGDDWSGGRGVAAVWTSTDGRVWSRVPHDEAVFGGSDGQGMASVTVGGPGLVAVGDDWSGGRGVAAVWTSTDGRVWSRVPHDEAVFGGPGDQGMASVTAGGPGLVAVGEARSDDGGVAAVWTSTDGRVWSRVPHDEAVFGGPGDQGMASVTAGGPGLVAVGWVGDKWSDGDLVAAVWMSPDGRVWSRVPNDEAVFGGKMMRSVTVGGLGLIAVGEAWSGGFGDAAVWTSPDGRVWSRVPHDESVFGGPDNQSMRSVTVGGLGLIAVGEAWSGGHGDAAVWTSPDGRVWSRVPHDETAFGDKTMRSVSAGGPGLVAVGYGDGGAVVWTSPDGRVWSRVPHDEAVFGGPEGQSMSSVTAGGPGLVAVGWVGDTLAEGDQDAAVWTSPDGWVWSRVPHDEAVFGGPRWQEMTSVTAGGPGLVAVGYDASGSDGHLVAAVWTSLDGGVWSRVPHDEAVFGGPGHQWMWSVTAGSPGLVAVGEARSDDGGSVAAVWTSVDGRVWSRVPHDEAVFGGRGSQVMWSVTAGGPGLVAVGQAQSGVGHGGAAVWTSTDGRVWSRVRHDKAVFGDKTMRSVTAGGPGLVAVGGDWSESGGGVAAVWTSADGRGWLRVPHDEAVFGGRGNQEMWSVTVDGPGLVAVGRDWSGGDLVAAVWTSPDGRVWSRVPDDEAVFGGPSDLLPSERSMSSVTAGGPGLVAVGRDWSGGDLVAAVWTSTE
jgi:hypothetical protein